MHPLDDIVARAASLADAFRAKHLPVILVNAAGQSPGRTEQGGGHEMPDGWTDLLPELNQHPDDKTVTKYTWGAFHNTDLGEHLVELGITQVVIAGVATSIGVDSTARQAHEHGYNVVLVADAMTDLSHVAHENSINNIFPRLGEMTTVADLLALLDRTGG
ncbi:isochorismatase family protein [Nocardia jiangxiensis]|uniref:Isochorismatase family protein n=1 Tax=Nocardia jiangxiensis TaxID=282685 RepID=A0ABW6SE31_9NOCA|nr:isochorismatase family protein [Nocardia jiangxiensis]